MTGYDERLTLFHRDGRQKWRFPIPEAYGRALAFSADSKMVYVGECSMDGTLYGVDVDDGKKRWAYSVGDDVGRPPPRHGAVSYATLDKCCVYAMAASQEALFAVGTHRDRRITRHKTGAGVVNDHLDTVLYAFQPVTGELLWRYPEKGTMDTHMPYPLYSEALHHILGANTSYWREGTPEEKYPNGTVRLIDAGTGAQSAFFRVMPLFTSFTSIWYSLSVSPNGRYISVGTVDGRLILFEVQKGPSLRRLWERKVSSLLEVSGIPIYSCSSHSAVFNDGHILMTTSGTHARHTTVGMVRQPPTQHPDSNSVFLFDRSGQMLWKWKAPGDITGMCVHMETGLAVVIVEHNYVEKALDASGFYFMKTTGSHTDPVKHLGALQLSGISTSGALSPDGSFFVGIELPVRLTDDTLVGEHKLHIIPSAWMVHPSDDE